MVYICQMFDVSDEMEGVQDAAAPKLVEGGSIMTPEVSTTISSALKTSTRTFRTGLPQQGGVETVGSEFPAHRLQWPLGPRQHKLPRRSLGKLGKTDRNGPWFEVMPAWSIACD